MRSLILITFILMVMFISGCVSNDIRSLKTLKSDCEATKAEIGDLGAKQLSPRLEQFKVKCQAQDWW